MQPSATCCQSCFLSSVSMSTGSSFTHLSSVRERTQQVCRRVDGWISYPLHRKLSWIMITPDMTHCNLF